MSVTDAVLDPAGRVAESAAQVSSPSHVPAADRRFAGAMSRVRAACQEHGLGEEHLLGIFADRPDLTRAISHAFRGSDSPPTRRELQALVEALDHMLELDEPLDVDLASPATKVARGARNVFAGAVLLMSTWIVVGAILTGENEMSATTSPLATLGMLAFALVVLGLLEAAHIGAVALSTADVGALEASHPRVFRLHRHISTKGRLEEYLAARQLGVVTIVFLIAEVTRTAGLQELPGTSLTLPSFAEPLLRIGVPGALMVLVIGQVAPQIITARRPAELMNLGAMAAAFSFTRMIGKLGLARPATWLMAWSPGTERIPTSARERFNSVTEDVEGSGVLVTRREVEVGDNVTTTTNETTIAVRAGGPNQLVSESASMPKAPNQMRMQATLLRDGEESPAVMESMEEGRATDRTGVTLRSTVAPRLGAFREGDIVDITTTSSFSEELREDYVVIDQPTKLVVLRAVLEHPAAPLPPALLTTTRKLEEMPYELQMVKPRMIEASGSVEFVAVVQYPAVGSVIRLAWGAPEESD